LKIDVEGGELFVIEGMLPVLERKRPFLVIEILPASNPDRLERQEAIERHLAALEYRLYRIRRSVGDRFEAFVPIETIGIQTGLENCDYVFAPQEATLP
jgi:hypothetical protein